MIPVTARVIARDDLVDHGDLDRRQIDTSLVQPDEEAIDRSAAPSIVASDHPRSPDVRAAKAVTSRVWVWHVPAGSSSQPRNRSHRSERLKNRRRARGCDRRSSGEDHCLTPASMLHGFKLSSSRKSSTRTRFS